MKPMIDQLNEKLEELDSEYKKFNAVGVPCTYYSAPMQFTHLGTLPTIALNEHTAGFLRNLANLLDEHFVERMVNKHD